MFFSLQITSVAVFFLSVVAVSTVTSVGGPVLTTSPIWAHLAARRSADTASSVLTSALLFCQINKDDFQYVHGMSTHTYDYIASDCLVIRVDVKGQAWSQTWDKGRCMSRKAIHCHHHWLTDRLTNWYIDQQTGELPHRQMEWQIDGRTSRRPDRSFVITRVGM